MTPTSPKSEIQSQREHVAIGRVRGLRVFAANSEGKLMGPISMCTWCDGINSAQCLSLRKMDRCPGLLDPSCTCGFYATTDIIHGYRFRGVLCFVEGFGKVVISERGFRAEKAKIIAIFLPDDTELNHWRGNYWMPSTVQEMIERNYRSAKVFSSLTDIIKEFPLGILSE
jgi:hypothetical protein